MKNKKTLITITTIAIIVVAIAVIASLIVYNSPSQKVKRQLSLGQKYLEELDYDNAIQAYRTAIAIDPMSEDAYIGIANAYIAQGDDEGALAILKEGIEAMGESEHLMSLKEEVEGRLHMGDNPQETGKITANKNKEDTQKNETSDLYDVWTHDLFDIWRYDLFGKDINDWTAKEFGAYLESNGYTRLRPYPPYIAGYTNDDLGEYAYFFGGEITVYVINKNGKETWSVNRDHRLTLDEGGMKYYDFPDVGSIKEDEFIARLPKYVYDTLINKVGLWTYFGQVQAEIDDSCVAIGPNEEQIPLRIYRFNFSQEGLSYYISFSRDGGDLMGLAIAGLD